MSSQEVRSICVFCGSSPGALPDYIESARALGGVLAEHGIRLVYGGASVGVMGALADAVLAAGGKAVGVIPRALWEREVAHTGLTELHVVESMHQRKAMMAELSDGFIALPGGIGTMEELFEVWTWAQLGMHRKPCGLLDVAGYYRPLIAFLDHMVEQHFVRDAHRSIVLVDHDPGALVQRFRHYSAPPVPQWIDQAQT